MTNIQKIRTLFTLITLVSALPGQKSIQAGPIAANNTGIASGIFANYGTAGFEFDGYVELQTKSGLFIESSAIAQSTDQGTINTSIGIMKKVSPDLSLGSGYSNYLNFGDSALNEAFLGFSSNSTTGVAFFGLGSEISPNYLGIINLNSLLSKIFFDASIMGIISKEMDIFGYDLFLNMTKTFDSGFTIGSSISSERYEDTELQTFKKQGNEKTFTLPVILQGQFISFFMGWTF